MAATNRASHHVCVLLFLGLNHRLPIIGKNERVVGFLGVREHHRYACRFGGDDERSKVFPKALDFGFGRFLFLRFILLARHDRTLAGKPMLNCPLSDFRIEGSPSFILTEISHVPSRLSIPSFCRRSARCRHPRRRGYGGRHRPDDLVAHRAYKASGVHYRY